ncbi:carbohydrate porin [Noviherbaspirillum sp. UKPF54]|uniref:carbohydrate porin n=1 Tax=Noviherbaspirillum sp. UKPF54 TaxID=2601898 RepID=UPI0011B181AA|nr:carbohydrate porin [Noviherbaspirillum sp. UKPF54]QDZ28500.1 carbohydrate porin [Noviherbaspirillum sp. UKPF54]
MRALPQLQPKPLALAAALLCGASGAVAAPPTQAELIRMLEKLNQRVERLELRNADLERELRDSRALPQAAQPAVEQRLQTLEQHQERIAKGLENDSISEKEPELVSRLKAVEMQSAGMLATARKMGALDGISAGLSLTTVAHKPYGVDGANSELNYRADAYVSLPLARVGDVEQKVFAQFRLGQGVGLNDVPVFSRPNATAFRLQGGLRADDSVALLAQAWYQADIPLPFGGFKPRSKETLTVNFGKMDPFVFFDQNAAAGDETRQFMNTVFVHNPLLDAGGDIGVDANGFAPGLRLSYNNVAGKPQTWRVSLGVFGAGEKGSNYERSLTSPLLMVQAETEQRMLDGLPGSYRIYAWSNPQATHFDTSVGGTERHTGWGVSADQRVGDNVTLFGRYGQQMQGHVRFDHALTLGAELNGSYWSRGGDSLGLAAGFLKTSRAYRDATGAGNGERVAELYYRYRISKQFELSPNMQYIGNPLGDTGAGAIKMLGLRAQLNY